MIGAKGTVQLPRSSRSLALLGLALAVIPGCGDSPTDPPPVAATIVVSPSSAMLDAFGDTTRFTARALDQYGQEMVGAAVTYESSDEAVVTVDGAGLVTAVGNGSATVTAASGAVVGSATVTVEQMVAEVRVSPDSVTLVAVGDTVRLAAEALDSNGHGVAGAAFDWSSEDSVAAVDDAGLVTAVANGSVIVTAASGAAVDSTAVTVEQRVVEVRLSPDSVTLRAIGDTVRLAAEALDSNGHGVATAEFEWSSADSVAVVDDYGLVTAVANGGATVTAASGATADSTAVTVQQTVAEVVVSPASVTLVAIGDTVRLVAEALDSNGHGVAPPQLEWSSDNSVATVDAAGLVTANANGSATVTAATGSAQGSAAVTVEQKVAEVRVTPDSVTFLAIGRTLRLTTEALDSNGHPVAKARLDYRSSKEAVATVSSRGLVTAVEDGNARVTATSGAAVASTRVAVRAGYARDRAILVKFYESTGGADWSNNHNWLSDAPFDDWYGIEADSLGRVLRIVLVQNGLTGFLPRELGGLEKLQRLSLAGALFYAVGCSRGPPPLGGVERNTTGRLAGDHAETGYARSWSMHNAEGWTYGEDELFDPPIDTASVIFNRSPGRLNRLRGRIPPELGELANLEHLSLEANQLSGPLPPELGGLSSLRFLNFGLNQLSGSLPPELGNLAKLEVFGLAENELSGPLPGELWELTNLQELNLYDNEFTGTLPAALGNLVKLRSLTLTCNALTGALPPEIGNLAELRRMSLFGNLLSGEIPTSIARLSELEEVNFAANYYMTGPIPPGIGQLTNLAKLTFDNNRFSGPIPAELGQLTDVGIINLSHNRLTGEIPVELGDLAKLGFLALSENELTGPIPSELGELAELNHLSMGHNRLSGPIPPELGRLRQLRWLSVHENRLTGPVPPELGDLSTLRTLWISGNRGLSGPLPHDLVRAPVRSFFWDGTGLCAPRDRVFQAWLAGMSNRALRPNCRLISRKVFTALYEATGGSNWARSANWLTDAPVSSWFGVTVEDSLITELDLSDNELAGTLPMEVGDFVDLKRLDLGGNRLTDGLPVDLGALSDLETLDLSRNRFSGPVPRELASLGAIRRLDLSGNLLEGALPGSLTQMGSLRNFNWRQSGACAPEAGWFQTWLATIPTRAGPTCDTPLVLSVPVTYLTQATQDLDGKVPLVAGRPALLRVLAIADRANDYRPGARVSVKSAGEVIHAVDLQLGSSRGVPEQMDFGRLDQSYNVRIPETALRPGVEITVDIDPDSVMPRAGFDEVRVPLDVREMPPLELTIVPVVAESGAGGNVLDWVRSADDPAIEFMRAVLPVGDLDLTVREPFTIAQLPVARDVNDWRDLLQDIDLLRTAERGSGYWYAVVQREGDAGVAGVAYIGRRASAGIPDAEVFAHEVGHNMSLRHAPCGRPAQLDRGYPYRDGTIGVYGYDPRADTLVDPSTPDLMSYCHPRWISDFNFNKALEYRLEVETTAAAQTVPDLLKGSRLLLWGGVDTEGRLRLDPAFALDAPAKLPTGSGPYRVEGFAPDGTSAFAIDFAMEEASEGGGGFHHLIPFEEERLASLERIVLSGPEGSVELGRETLAPPIAIVIDRDSGRIRSILRGEAAENAVGMAAARAPGGLPARERVLVSYGLPVPPAR